MPGANRSIYCPGSWNSLGRKGGAARSSNSKAGERSPDDSFSAEVSLSTALANDDFMGGTPCVKDETCLCSDPTHVRELVNVTLDGLGCYACEPKRLPACTEAQDQCTPEVCECADPLTHVKHSATTVDGTPCHFCEPLNGIRTGLGMSELMIAAMVTSIVIVFHFLSRKPSAVSSRAGNLRLSRRRGDQSRAIRVQQEALSWYEEVLVTLADTFDALGEGVCDIASGIWYLVSGAVSMLCSGAVEVLCMMENGAHGVSDFVRRGAQAACTAVVNALSCGRRDDDAAARRKAKRKETSTPSASAQQTAPVATKPGAEAVAPSAKATAPAASLKPSANAAEAATKNAVAKVTSAVRPAKSAAVTEVAGSTRASATASSSSSACAVLSASSADAKAKATRSKAKAVDSCDVGASSSRLAPNLAAKAGSRDAQLGNAKADNTIQVSVAASKAASKQKDDAASSGGTRNAAASSTRCVEAAQDCIVDSKLVQKSEAAAGSNAKRPEAPTDSSISKESSAANRSLIEVNTFLAEAAPEVVLRRTASESDMTNFH